MVRHFLRNIFHDSAESESLVPLIKNRRVELSALSDAELKAIEWRAMDLPEVIALTSLAAERVLGLKMFDVQLQGALALVAGKIIEMQTGEGKTLAAVPAAVWNGREGAGVHVMTVNDYLARRDAQWMGGIYEFLGVSVGYVQQGMDLEERRRAYACDITYGTANEIGFDYLRDGLALYPAEQVHRPFATAMIDEADSILIDEARIPLVIAGGEANEEPLAYQVDRITRFFRRGRHFTLDQYARNIALTDAGIHAIVRGLAEKVCGSAKVKYGEDELDFSNFTRFSMRDAICKFWPAAAGVAPSTAEMAQNGGPRGVAERYNAYARSSSAEPITAVEKLSDGELTGELFEMIAEGHLTQPTFIYDFPTEISPLSKQKPDDPSLTERFELFIAGMEIANGFSELNDPADQERRFRAQVEKGGQEMPKEVDIDYIRALSHGLPPTAGEGIGIDRLVMLLTDSHAIREVILFPLLRGGGAR